MLAKADEVVVNIKVSSLFNVDHNSLDRQVTLKHESKKYFITKHSLL